MSYIFNDFYFSPQGVKTSSKEEVSYDNDYKVDSFFVTPHNQAIELFLSSDRPIQFWQDIPPLRKRYLSAGNVHNTRVIATLPETKREISQPVTNKWISLQDLQSMETIETSSCVQNHSEIQSTSREQSIAEKEVKVSSARAQQN